MGMPMFDVPSRRTIVRDILQMYVDMKTSLMKQFRESKVQGEFVGKCIELVLLDWGIDRIFTIIVDNASSNKTVILYVKIKLKSWNADGLILDGKWNSTYLMLSSSLKFVKAFDRTNDEDRHYQNYFMETENEPKKIEPPNFEYWENANEFVQFLKTFDDVTLQFSATLSVTSNLYFHKWGKINNQLTLRGDGNHLKLQYMSYCFAVLYGAGSSESITANIKDALVELYESYNALYGGSGGSGGSTNGGGSVDETPLFCSGEIDDSSIFDLSVTFSETVEKQDNVRAMNEVERYLLESVERKRPNFDVLTWWNVNSACYPILVLIAKDVFAMPISTVASESAFSGGGRVLDSFQSSSLNPKMVECLICTQNRLQDTYRTNQLGKAIMNTQNDAFYGAINKFYGAMKNFKNFNIMDCFY
ncbi:hypothetical protein Dsin_018630 [Dipteronia sinensis]|uniref:HAT C-terminal dimerisation domain-containing protein n=1 Tax=Dipteronia sinensis TaxID=43782 RepID=A0AAE0E3A3_9ROSI|nr:hypothetical protein Dsin_018630 [Dipteronia sinensis]